MLLCDDDGVRVQTWKSRIEGVPNLRDQVDVRALTPTEFAEVYAALEERQVAARRGVETSSNDRASILDDTDILIVDFDLTPRQQQELGDDSLRQLVGSFGDVFAYLARCYTSVGFTVLVNQTFYQSTFDLTMSEFTFSFADLNVSDSDLARGSLWFGCSENTEFRPWHWPRLLSSAALLRRIESRLDLEANIFEAIGMTLDELQLLDAKQLEPLGAPDTSAGRQGLRFKDLAGENCHFGRRSRSEVLFEPQERRLAAAALSHWLERVILPAQNIYVDAPHLAERRPDLVQEGGWEALTDLNQSDLSATLRLDELKTAETSVSEWTSRPVWSWLACPPESSDFVGDSERVFCEDTSSFVSFQDAIEFRASVPGPWTQRFVSRALAEDDSPGGAEGLRIDYRPETRFY